MKNPTSMSNLKLVQWLDKTNDSIQNHCGRFWKSPMNNQGLDLADRYGELMYETKRRGDVWDKYCSVHGYDVNHDQYDLFA